MNYYTFQESLKKSDWKVPNKSFASKQFNEWQISFVRMGGRYQLAGSITFVICVRHTLMRNINSEHVDMEKEPHSYPFKLTLSEIEKGNLRYQSKLLNYDMSRLSVNDDWSEVKKHLEQTIPSWLLSVTKDVLAKEIEIYGESGYIENIWLKDLS
jgi:hypothetical protein